MVRYDDETITSKTIYFFVRQINAALKCLESGENIQARNELESALTNFANNCLEYGANIVLAAEKIHCPTFQEKLDCGEIIEAY